MTTETRNDTIGELRANARVLLGCTIGACVSVTGLLFYSSSVFFARLQEALGWGPDVLGIVHAAFTASVALSVPIAGMMLDRFGSRRPIGFSFAAVVVAYVLIAILPATLPLYIGLHVVLGSLGSACSSVGFSRIVSARFDRARGLALGIVIGGLGLTAVIVPPLLTMVIADYGWRGGYISLAGAVGVIGALSLWIIGPPAASPGGKAAKTSQTLTLSMFGGVFWLLLFVFAIAGIFSTGYLVHLVAIVEQRGVSGIGASGFASLAGVGLLIGRVSSGWLMDRFFAPRVGAAVFIGFAIGLAMLASGSATLLIPAVLLIGMCLGSELDVAGYLVSRYFPIGSFGRVYGIIYSAIMITSGLSALLIVKLSQGGSDYNTAFWASCAALVLVSVALLFAPPFPQELAPATTGPESAGDDRSS